MDASSGQTWRAAALRTLSALGFMSSILEDMAGGEKGWRRGTRKRTARLESLEYSRSMAGRSTSHVPHSLTSPLLPFSALCTSGLTYSLALSLRIPQHNSAHSTPTFSPPIQYPIPTIPTFPISAIHASQRPRVPQVLAPLTVAWIVIQLLTTGALSQVDYRRERTS